MPKIDNWSVIVYGSPYTPPEMCTQHLMGIVTGHPRQEEFHSNIQVTSPIKGKKDGKVVTNSGTHYELGVVGPAYEQEYPGAKERLLNSLPEIE